MDKKALEKIRNLLSSYQIACDNILYKHGNHKQDEMDCEDMIELIERELDKQDGSSKDMIDPNNLRPGDI